MRFTFSRTSIMGGMLIAVLLLSACAGLGQTEVVIEPETLEQRQAAQDQAQTQQDGRMAGAQDAADVLITASSLSDYNFSNRDGEVTGEIEDVIVDAASGEVLYVNVEYGGFLDLGDTELPMPLRAFAWSPDGDLILNFDEQALEDFPDLGTDWFDPGVASWDDEVAGFWNNIGLTPQFDYTEPTNTVVRVDDLIGYDIGDIGLGANNVDDLLIDLGESRIEYVLVAYDPGLFNDELVAVPFNAFQPMAIDSNTSFNDGQLYLRPEVDAATIESAPRFTQNEMTGANNYSLFSEADTYWGDLGYGPNAAFDDQTGMTDQSTGTAGEPRVEPATIAGVGGAPGNLVRASRLLDYNISSVDNDNIGEIEDILIDVETGNILFATLEYGGILDLGDREIPIPLSAFSWAGNNTLSLNVTEEQLDQLPELGNDWPNVADASWNDDVAGFWNNLGVAPGYGATDSQTVMYISNLIDLNLADFGLGAEGAIHDILIDLSNAQAQHVIVDYGGLFDNDLVAVPFSAIDVNVVDDGFQFTPNVSVDVLRNAPDRSGRLR
ncbi:MAG: PRC-barrel domain-containing protein [Caldilineaceae bacterium]